MFLSPLFLIAAALGAAIPLVLHVMQNKRRDVVPFPTLRFLKQANSNSSRRMRLENLLLWLLRTLIMLLLGAAFAMPMLKTKGVGWFGNAPRDVAIVLDASFSMNYNTGRNTVWEKAIETCSAIISGLGENDRYCIYLARNNPEPLIAQPTVNKEDGLLRLKATGPGNTSSRLAPALMQALRTLRKAEGRREREIHIITDTQLLPWLSFDVSKAASGAAQAMASDAAQISSGWNPEELDKHTTLFVSLLGVTAPENVTPASIEIRPALLRKGAPAELVLTLSKSGQATQTAATLFLDGQQISRRSIDMAGPDGLNPVFPLPDLSEGVHTGRIETPEDNLQLDNAFHFLVRVEKDMPSLIVGTKEDTLFLRTAFKAAAGGREPISIGAERLVDETLNKYASVFLCNALPLSGQALTAVEQYVRNGGLLVLFPGMKATPEAYSAWSCLPAVPTGIEEVPNAKRNQNLVWDKPQHVLLRPLRSGITVPMLTTRRMLTFAKPHETTQRLISLGAEQPFLLDRPYGQGRTLMFAVAADRTWSDLPLSPYYLPLVLQCAEYGATLTSKKPFLWTTDTLSLGENLPEAKETSTLFSPNARPVPIRSRMVEQRPVLFAEDVTMPGIYGLAQAEAAEPVPALAINVPRDESDLTATTAENVRERTGLKSLNIATDLDELRKIIEEHRVGRTYGEHLLWLAFLLIAAEFVIANALMRSGPRLTEQLNLDAAGGVKGHLAQGQATTSQA